MAAFRRARMLLVDDSVTYRTYLAGLLSRDGYMVEAVANAEAALAEDEASELAERMLKAARGLVKEGDRALQRIQPLWTAQADKYGDAFREAMRDHGRINRLVRRLLLRWRSSALC